MQLRPTNKGGSYEQINGSREMDGNRLTIAIKEAKRFVSVAESALGKIKEDSLLQITG